MASPASESPQVGARSTRLDSSCCHRTLEQLDSIRFLADVQTRSELVTDMVDKVPAIPHRGLGLQPFY